MVLTIKKTKKDTEVQSMISKLFFQSLLYFLASCLVVVLIGTVIVIYTVGINAITFQSLIYNAFLKSIPAGVILTCPFVAFLWNKNRLSKKR